MRNEGGRREEEGREKRVGGKASDREAQETREMNGDVLKIEKTGRWNSKRKQPPGGAAGTADQMCLAAACRVAALLRHPDGYWLPHLPSEAFNPFKPPPSNIMVVSIAPCLQRTMYTYGNFSNFRNLQPEIPENCPKLMFEEQDTISWPCSSQPSVCSFPTIVANLKQSAVTISPNVASATNRSFAGPSDVDSINSPWRNLISAASYSSQDHIKVQLSGQGSDTSFFSSHDRYQVQSRRVFIPGSIPD